MNTFKKQAAQGDLLIIVSSAIPTGFSLAKPVDGQHVLAHSETGHHHVVEAPKVDMFTAENDDFVAYIEVKEPCQVIHLRGWDTHAPISLDKGIYRINRQREYTPEGYRRAAD